ncbi:hypothetical protein RP20_CCG010282 [Aedes albopictus]|nr:hypothetical protein RP20_CCG010282 [Aedes albopictus]
MASVTPMIPTAVNGRQTPMGKLSSPYRPGPVKSRYTKSPNKVSRNNTFIATSRRMAENGGDGLRFTSVDDDHQGKVKCVSAGAVEGLKQEPVYEGSNLVDIFNGDTVKLSGSEEDQQLEEKEVDSPIVVQPTVSEDIPKKPSAIPVKTKSSVVRPIRSQRSIFSGNDSKTIKFLLKLTTKSYFETLKYEIDRIKENERKMQDQASSHAQSIMALISKGVDFDRKMEELRAQNVKLLLETREKDRIQLDTVNAITSELNELNMSSVETGSDMLTDIEITSDKKSRSTRTSRKSLNLPAIETYCSSGE